MIRKMLIAILPLFIAFSLHADEETVKHVGPDEAEKIVKAKSAQVLDIRTPKEFSAGHIAGATNVDFYDPLFEAKLKALDKSKTYMVHCASGGRSTKALELFKKHQFKSVVHLDGGFKAWEKAGKPVEK